MEAIASSVGTGEEACVEGARGRKRWGSDRSQW